ncbi:hypothetical protein ACOMCU_00245 [Lysinibacillus sp. UGB7]|uniref:hypothetical protein n=1 Tax=Lysinibacillus sp. UGB7 TaxID=3411039 RepID=UPI003B75F82A
MKIEASVESTELEGYLYNVLNKKMDQVDVEIVFSEKDMTDYIKVTNQNGETVIEKPMDESFEMIKEALFNDSVKLKIISYQPTEEGFDFVLMQ